MTAFNTPATVFADAKRAISEFRTGNWQSLLAIYIAFSLVSALVLTPLITVALQAAISFSGQSALSDTEIATFLLSPAGAIAGIVIASVALTIGLVTYAALLVATHASLHGSTAHLYEIFKTIAARGPHLIKLSLRFTFAILLTALPFVAIIGVIYLTFISENDINYYLAERPPEFIKAVALAALTLIILATILIKLAINWFFALPLVLFSRIGAKRAQVKSKTLSKGKHKHIALWLSLWIFTTPLLITLFNAPFNLLAGWMIPQLADRLPLLALTLGGTLAITTTISFLTGFITLSLLAHHNIDMFDSSRLDIHVPIPTKSSQTFSIPLKEKYAFVGGFIVLIISGFVCYLWVSSLQKADSSMIIAHRGSSMDAPENTLAAIQLAVDSGADWVEIDVQETADGEVVVFHDSDYKRVAGKKLNIWNAQSSELPSIDIGSWFAPEFADQTTPSLKQVLEMCRDKSGVLIELKYYGHDVALEQKVIDIVEAANMQDQVMAMSLSYPAVQKMRELRPEWKLGLLSTVALGDITKLDVDFLGLNSRAATPSLIKRAHDRDIDIYVWTVNAPLDISAMTSRGVDGIITDTPTTVQSVIQQRADLTPGQRLLLELAHTFGRGSNELIQ